jgi:release factor glutamine methyltransferase
VRGPHVPTSARVRSAIVTRLRAAGCVFAEEEARLLVAAARTPDDLAAMVERRAAGEPVEHVIGWAEFCGLRLAVDPGVFVPRRRTEFLVRQAVPLVRRAARRSHAVRPSTREGSLTPGRTQRGTEAVRPSTREGSLTPGRTQRGSHAGPRAVVVDLCCGSGAVGAALAAAVDGVELHAVDIDPAAVRCARRNVAAAGGQVYEGDLFEPLPPRLRGRVDVLVANAPYVPAEAVGLLPPEARVHEPRVALDGGVDGLDVLRRVVTGAPPWLAPGGHLLVETSERQARHLVETVARNGLIPRVVTSDELSATVVVGNAPRSRGVRPSGRGR